MRITVYDILSYLAAGMEVNEILADFAELTREGILACLAYSADVEKRSIVALQYNYIFWIRAIFILAEASISKLDLLKADDKQIWDLALQNDYVIPTKDWDSD